MHHPAAFLLSPSTVPKAYDSLCPDEGPRIHMFGTEEVVFPGRFFHDVTFVEFIRQAVCSRWPGMVQHGEEIILDVTCRSP